MNHTWEDALADIEKWHDAPKYDAEYENPTWVAIAVAGIVAKFSQREGSPAPDRCIPDGEGGLCLVRNWGGKDERYHIYKDGSAERMVFEGCKLVTRDKFSGKLIKFAQELNES